MLYTSPELIHYPFDGCNTCYSPAQPVSVRNLNINVQNVTTVELRFVNNRRNAQVRRRK